MTVTRAGLLILDPATQQPVTKDQIKCPPFMFNTFEKNKKVGIVPGNLSSDHNAN